MPSFKAGAMMWTRWACTGNAGMLFVGGVHDSTVVNGDTDEVKCWLQVDDCGSDCRKVTSATGVCDSGRWCWI